MLFEFMTNLAKKPAEEILEQQLSEAEIEFNRPKRGLLLASISAGIDVGVSLFLMAVTWTLVHDLFPSAVTAFLLANLYSVGYILVILGRSELFTEHTTMAMFPVLEGRADLKKLARLWILVWTGNMIGASFFAMLTAVVGPMIGNISTESLVHIAEKILRPAWWLIFLGATLTGWLMGLLSWVVTASKETIAQIVIVWIVTFTIGLGGLHHSVVGTVEVIAGLMVSPEIGWGDFLKFISAATLGNAIGGSIFVAFFKYQHARLHGVLAQSKLRVVNPSRIPY